MLAAQHWFPVPLPRARKIFNDLGQMQNMCPDHTSEACAIQTAHCSDVNKFCPILLKTPKGILKRSYPNVGFPFMH